MRYVYDYISRIEYACPCCSTLPVDFSTGNPANEFVELFEAFKDVREEWGSGLKISSGYRCPNYNKQIGGTALSVHQWGLALDIDCADSNMVEELSALIQELHPELRRGEYTETGSFIHIDSGYLIYPRATFNWETGVRWYA